MLLKYLKHGVRLLLRSPYFSTINILGLSVGFAAFFALWQYTNAELATDQHFKDYQRIARIGCYWKWKEEVSVGQMTCGSIPYEQIVEIANDFPQITEYARVLGGFAVSLSRETPQRRSFTETEVVLADSNLLQLFSIPLLLGDGKTALHKPNSVVLSRSKAIKYFGNDNPINQLLLVNDSISATVTGLFEDFHNTHLNFSIILSNPDGYRKWNGRTHGQWATCYIRVNPGTDLEDLEFRIQQNKLKYWEYEFKRWSTSDADFFVQPLEEISFSDHFWGDTFWPKSRFTLEVLRVAAILILLMGWINFINLTVARTSRRLKEVALRKIVGAGWRDLMLQFAMESAIAHLLAIGMALTFIQLARVPLQIFFGVDLPSFEEISGSTWITSGAMVIGGIFVTAWYPAITSFAHNPRSLLMARVKGGLGRIVPKFLTTFQYASALMLIVWVSLVSAQLYFILHKRLGINIDQVVLVEIPTLRPVAYDSRFQGFLDAVRREREATYGRTLMGDAAHWRVRIKRVGQQEYFQIDCHGGVDETFIPFFGVRLLAGRNFGPGERPNVVVLSRYVSERLGFARPEDAIGRLVDIELNSGEKVEIIGVMEDYPLRPFVNYGEDTGHPDKSRNDGIILTYKRNVFPEMMPGKVALRVGVEHVEESIRSIEAVFGKSFPEAAFTWTFLTDHINRSYDQERILSRQIALLASLAIGIACLGFLGMVSNDAEQKTKEIGIRKVLGASLRHIGKLLLQSSFSQMTIALLIGVPVAWYLGQRYLEKYSHRVEFQWWHITVPIAFMLILLFGTTLTVLWKAATHNPVEALKHE